jgi:RNA polymerase sigma-70 factor (ECF subfamily)
VTSTDRELLEAWRAGDRHAGDELFGRYFRSLFMFFASKLAEGVEDAISRTMLGCLQNLHRVHDGGSFRGYLFGVARHEVFAHYRALRTGPDIDFAVSSVCDLGPTPR